MFEDLNVAGVEVVVRNSHGEIKAALSEIVPMPSFSGSSCSKKSSPLCSGAGFAQFNLQG